MQSKFNPGEEENLEKYELGGYHPVKIGDTFDDGRYTIVHKLGSGGFSTVWLARDTLCNDFVALKIATADSSKDLRELQVQSILSTNEHDNAQPAISNILSSFDLEGPNGQHKCLVFKLYGPSLAMLTRYQLKLRSDIARGFARTITKTVNYIHEKDLAVGDLSMYNILLAVQDGSQMTTEELYSVVGEPDAQEVVPYELKDDPYAHAPKAYYFSINWHTINTAIFKPEVVLTDLNEAVYAGNGASPFEHGDGGSGMNPEYMSPEIAFGIDSKHPKASDIFALGYIFYELRAATKMMELTWTNLYVEMQYLLGPLPETWKEPIKDKPELWEYMQEPEKLKHKKSLKHRLQAIGECMPWVTMTPAERRQLVIDTQGEEALEDEDNPMIQMIDDYTPPPAKLSEEEAADFEDLLQKMLCWRPEDRITIDEVLQHPWLNKDYDDVDESEPWIEQFHPGWDPQPVMVIEDYDEEEVIYDDGAPEVKDAVEGTEQTSAVLTSSATTSLMTDDFAVSRLLGLPVLDTAERDHTDVVHPIDEEEEHFVTKLLGLPLPQSTEETANGKSFEPSKHEEAIEESHNNAFRADSPEEDEARPGKLQSVLGTKKHCLQEAAPNATTPGVDLKYSGLVISAAELGFVRSPQDIGNDRIRYYAIITEDTIEMEDYMVSNNIDVLLEQNNTTGHEYHWPAFTAEDHIPVWDPFSSSDMLQHRLRSVNTLTHGPRKLEENDQAIPEATSFTGIGKNEASQQQVSAKDTCSAICYGTMPGAWPDEAYSKAVQSVLVEEHDSPDFDRLSTVEMVMQLLGTFRSQLSR